MFFRSAIFSQSLFSGASSCDRTLHSSHSRKSCLKFEWGRSQSPLNCAGFEPHLYSNPWGRDQATRRADVTRDGGRADAGAGVPHWVPKHRRSGFILCCLAGACLPPSTSPPPGPHITRTVSPPWARASRAAGPGAAKVRCEDGRGRSRARAPAPAVRAPRARPPASPRGCPRPPPRPERLCLPSAPFASSLV